MKVNPMRIVGFARAWAAGILAAFLLYTGASAETVRVGIVNATTDVPFYIADAKGYFRDEELEVELVSFDAGAKMIAPLGTGALDAGGGAASVGLYNAVGRGIEIKIVADKAHFEGRYATGSLLVRAALKDQVRGYADLKGLRIAVVAPGTSDESVVNEALKHGGLTWGDAQIIYLGFPQMPAAFQNAAIDASIANEPTRTLILRGGWAIRFADTDAFYPNQQASTLLYGTAFIRKNATAAVKFMRAYLRASRFYNEALADGHLAGPTAPEVVDILVKYSLVKDKELYKMLTPQALDPDGRLNLASMRNDWQFFRDTHQIDGSITVDSVVDTSFAAEAAAKLGPYHPAKSPQEDRHE
jgi:NitT/TauT family transport system substrate-binding protein